MSPGEGTAHSEALHTAILLKVLREASSRALFAEMGP